MSEHDPLCEDSEGLPRYRQCVCFPVRQARERERQRIKDGLLRYTTVVIDGVDVRTQRVPTVTMERLIDREDAK